MSCLQSDEQVNMNSLTANTLNVSVEPTNGAPEPTTDRFGGTTSI
jgi:hypothetical protein